MIGRIHICTYANMNHSREMTVYNFTVTTHEILMVKMCWLIRNLCMCVCSVVSNSLQPHGLYPARLLCPSNFQGNDTGVGWHFLLQGIFSAQGVNPHLLCLLHQQANSLPVSHERSPRNLYRYSNIN